MGSDCLPHQVLLPNEHDAKERGESWRLPKTDLLAVVQERARAQDDARAQYDARAQDDARNGTKQDAAADGDEGADEDEVEDDHHGDGDEDEDDADGAADESDSGGYGGGYGGYGYGGKGGGGMPLGSGPKLRREISVSAVDALSAMHTDPSDHYGGGYGDGSSGGGRSGGGGGGGGHGDYLGAGQKLRRDISVNAVDALTAMHTHSTDHDGSHYGANGGGGYEGGGGGGGGGGAAAQSTVSSRASSSGGALAAMLSSDSRPPQRPAAVAHGGVGYGGGGYGGGGYGGYGGMGAGIGGGGMRGGMGGGMGAAPAYSPSNCLDTPNMDTPRGLEAALTKLCSHLPNMDSPGGLEAALCAANLSTPEDVVHQLLMEARRTYSAVSGSAVSGSTVSGAEDAVHQLLMEARRTTSLGGGAAVPPETALLGVNGFTLHRDGSHGAAEHTALEFGVKSPRCEEPTALEFACDGSQGVHDSAQLPMTALEFACGLSSASGSFESGREEALTMAARAAPLSWDEAHDASAGMGTDSLAGAVLGADSLAGDALAAGGDAAVSTEPGGRTERRNERSPRRVGLSELHGASDVIMSIPHLASDLASAHHGATEAAAPSTDPRTEDDVAEELLFRLPPLPSSASSVGRAMDDAQYGAQYGAQCGARYGASALTNEFESSPTNPAVNLAVNLTNEFESSPTNPAVNLAVNLTNEFESSPTPASAALLPPAAEAAAPSWAPTADAVAQSWAPTLRIASLLNSDGSSCCPAAGGLPTLEHGVNGHMPTLEHGVNGHSALSDMLV